MARLSAGAAFGANGHVESAEAELFEPNQPLQRESVEAAALCAFKPAMPSRRQLGRAHQHQMHGFETGGGIGHGRNRCARGACEHWWLPVDWVGGYYAKLVCRLRGNGPASCFMPPPLIQVGPSRTSAQNRAPSSRVDRGRRNAPVLTADSIVGQQRDQSERSGGISSQGS